MISQAIGKTVLAGCLGAAAIAIAAESSIAVPLLRLHGDHPIVMAEIDGIAVPLQFDTGDQSAVSLQRSVLDKIKRVPLGKSEQLQYAHGPLKDRKWYEAHSPYVELDI